MNTCLKFIVIIRFICRYWCSHYIFRLVLHNRNRARKWSTYPVKSFSNHHLICEANQNKTEARWPQDKLNSVDVKPKIPSKGEQLYRIPFYRILRGCLGASLKWPEELELIGLIIFWSIAEVFSHFILQRKILRR